VVLEAVLGPMMLGPMMLGPMVLEAVLGVALVFPIY
jgi:hypothetical protein